MFPGSHPFHLPALGFQHKKLINIFTLIIWDKTEIGIEMNVSIRRQLTDLLPFLRETIIRVL